MKSRILVCALFSVFVSACSHGGVSSLPSTDALNQQGSSRGVQSASSAYRAGAENIFAAAQGRTLSYEDVDTYIDPSVVGQDRALAHKLMGFMPANLRGDFVYVRRDGTLLSNNPAKVAETTVKYEPAPKQASSITPSRPSSSFRGVDAAPGDYSSPCSPPDPPNNPGGAYARLVSVCGYTAGWGFVSIPQGTSNMEPGDNGYLYFEIQAPHQGTTTEGGFEYYSDSSIAPYARSSAPEYVGQNGGYIQINGGSNRENADQLLFVNHGITSNGEYMYVVAGRAPSGLDPQTTFISGSQFTAQNAGWNFFDASADMEDASGATIAPGLFSPCAMCSVSQVVSIGQSAANTSAYGQPGQYAVDGSYFGTLSNDGIQWNQVQFGVMDSNCTQGTSLCTFDYPSSPAVAYGGAQYYPYQGIADADPEPSGYGPYESYDSIDLSGISGYNVKKKPAGSYSEPLPPIATPTPVATATPVATPKPVPTVKPAPPCYGAVKQKNGTEIICPQTGLGS